MTLSVIAADYGGPSPESELMRKSAERVKVPVRLYGSGNFTSWRKRLEDSLDVIRVLDTTHVLMLDAYDTLFVRGLDSIWSGYAGYSHPPLLLSTERDSWPHGHLADRYPASETPWRFVNGGGWMGERDYLMEHIPKVLAMSDSANDQELWAFALLDGRLPGFKLDTWCRVFQAMSRTDLTLPNGVVFNAFTGSQPCILHYNGKTEGREELWQSLNRQS